MEDGEGRKEGGERGGGGRTNLSHLQFRWLKLPSKSMTTPQCDKV